MNQYSNNNNEANEGSLFTGNTGSLNLSAAANSSSNSGEINNLNSDIHQQTNINRMKNENSSISAQTSDSNQNNNLGLQFSNITFPNNPVVHQQRQYDNDAHSHPYMNLASAAMSWPDADMPSKLDAMALLDHQDRHHDFHRHPDIRPEHLLTHEQFLTQEHLLTQEQLLNPFSPVDSVGPGGGHNSSFLNDRERIQLHNQLSWEEATKQDILFVRCRDTTAELYKSRLGSGSKGKCLKMGDSWFTPTEFETIAGRGSSKDWKRSIRFGGHTLQKLIEEGILAPHAISCTCSICCGDSTLTGPVRLFTPYKRKRRGVENSRSPTINRTRRTMESPSHSSGFHQLSALTNSLASGLMSMTQSLHSSHYTFDQIDEIMNLIATATQQLRLAWDQTKLQADAVREAAVNQVRIQAEMDKREALSHQRNEVVSILKRILPVEHEAIIQQLLTQLHIDNMATPKSCSNCGRDAYLECTACRRACYCSTFCQQKDWPLHQHQCATNAMDQSLVEEQQDSNQAA